MYESACPALPATRAAPMIATAARSRRIRFIKRVCKIADPEALSLLQLAARQAVGVPPDQRRKARVKALASEYPSAAAI